LVHKLQQKVKESNRKMRLKGDIEALADARRALKNLTVFSIEISKIISSNKIFKMLILKMVGSYFLYYESVAY
jgi:hypothetical protein